MSASPSRPNGQRPTPPPGAAPLRRRPQGNPLVPRKKPLPRPPPAKGQPLKGPSSSIASKPFSKPLLQQPLGSQAPPNFEQIRRQNGGWSTPKPANANEYPLYMTPKQLKAGLNFHIMKLAPAGNKNVTIDPTDQKSFTRPVTLHRRDPRQPPPGREVKGEDVSEQPPANIEEAEKLAQQKAEREAQRALDDAQKAPVLKDMGGQKRPQPNKKQEKRPGTQVHYAPRTEEQKKQADIRYKEALPWHLEDADGKNVWVGQYEAPLSDSKIALVIDKNGFRMLPLEKWYKFTSKRGAFQALSIDEAEKIMAKNTGLGRWAIRDADREKAEKAMESSRYIVNGGAFVKQESRTFQQSSRGEKMDHDDLDISGDEFQDDDETAGYEPDRDEEAKTSKDRVRREQLGANLFGDADEKTVEKEEAAVKKEEEERKVFGKNLKKALKRRDKDFMYESDDSTRERDPFASSSSESEADEDAEKKDEDKKDEKDKDKDKDKEKTVPSGTSSKGTNTPQGKKKAAEVAKKAKSLKRPGSPIHSDSSGAESTRKKKKTGPSAAESRGSTPLPQRAKAGAGSTSDGEGTAGEMSDGAGGKKKKHARHLAASARATPSESRAGSPAPPEANSSAANRAGSPAPRDASPAVSAQSPGQKYIDAITPQEIVDALPPFPQGISIGAFLRRFMHRLDKPGYMTRKEWLKLVNENANFNTQEKLLRRRA